MVSRRLRVQTLGHPCVWRALGLAVRRHTSGVCDAATSIGRQRCAVQMQHGRSNRVWGSANGIHGEPSVSSFPSIEGPIC